MKRNLFLIAALFTFCLSFAQVQDLATMAKGKLDFSSTVYDANENLYGYLYIYEKNVTERNKTMEYVLLDKNLNKVSNAEFSIEAYKEVFSTYYDCTLMDDYIILNKYFYYIAGFTGMSKPLLTTFQIINLKNNSISLDYVYEDNKLSSFKAEFDDMKKIYKKNDSKYIVNCFANSGFKGFIITEDNKKDSYLEKDIIFLGEDRNELWRYTYNPDGRENRYNTFKLLTSDKKNIYLTVSKWYKDPSMGLKLQRYSIVAVDIKTGEEIYEYELENKAGPFTHSVSARVFDNKLYLTGRYKTNSDYATYDYLGLYRVVIDSAGREENKQYVPWEKFASSLKINKRGKVNTFYRLNPTRYFIFKDGSVSFLSEMYKTFNSSFVITDFVIFNMDKNFEFKNINIIKKEKSYYGSDFRFYQYIKDDSAVVFFYTDDKLMAKADEPRQTLGITTLTNGEITEETVPLITKKKYYIQPMPAKEGYIMLREYNEVDKYNKIRLEKLNY